MEDLVETLGTGTVIAIVGVVVGIVFGAAAQYSKFCLRAATVEIATGAPGPRLAVWLVAFLAALTAVQSAILLDWLSVSDARQLASVGSMSGAIVGGLMFGIGMILARGCASRLLVLSATGNLRALVTGLVLTVVAQASLTGVLAPAREAIAGLWQVPGGSGRDLLVMLGVTTETAAIGAGVALMAALAFALWTGVGRGPTIAAALVGLAVAGGWVGTYAVAQNSFDIVGITSVTFTGPSTDTLMGFVTARQMPLSFGVGLVPGVFIGAAASALMSGTWAIQRFGPDAPMERYLVGAVLMGFGSMLAGGCAVGAGMSGGAIFAMTAWVAVFCMWIGAVVTQLLMARTATRTALA